MTDVAIVSAKRTAIGTFNGAFSTVNATELGRAAIEASLASASLSADEPNELIFGQVLTAGQGQNTARQAAINAGMPDTTPAYTINHVCGSGLKAVGLASQAIRLGDSEIVIAGGQENMT
ncbi:MAG: thiolase family protein, partial [Alphaproteobacteria bacterium]